MEVYKGLLVFKKVTQQMVVYGNSELQTQYLPKSFFPKRKTFPEALIFSIVIPTIPETEATPTAKIQGQTKARNSQTKLTGTSVQKRRKNKPTPEASSTLG